MNRCLGHRAIAALAWLALAPPARAEPPATTIIKWGLLGSRAIDCVLPPDRNKHAHLAG